MCFSLYSSSASASAVRLDGDQLTAASARIEQAAYYRKFGLSRVMLREEALKGNIPGVVKASW